MRWNAVIALALSAVVAAAPMPLRAQAPGKIYQGGEVRLTRFLA
jgi:hypothetical protein